jgi:hypothetical protein
MLPWEIGRRRAGAAPVSFWSERAGEGAQPGSSDDSAVDQVQQLLHYNRLLCRIINPSPKPGTDRVTPSIVASGAVLEHADYFEQGFTLCFGPSVVSHLDLIPFLAEPKLCNL